MTELPEPLTPPDSDLRGLEWMPLYGDRLFTSETWLMASAEGRCAALALWWAAWKQTPAASLADDDRILAQLAGYGMAVKAWRAVREEAMRGFVKCSDGRLYHPVVAEFAREAWDRRVRDRDRKARWRTSRNADGDGDKGVEGRGQDGDETRTERGGDRSVRADRTGQDRTGQESRERELPPSPPSEAQPPRGARLPDDWQPSEADAAFARDLGLDAGAVAARFRDHWRAKPGKDGRKSDWSATWRNWCRRDADDAPTRREPQSKSGWLLREMAAEREAATFPAPRLLA